MDLQLFRICVVITGALLAYWDRQFSVAFEGTLVLFLPFVIYWFVSRGKVATAVMISGTLLTLVTLGGILLFLVWCDDPQCGLGFLYVIPLQYLAVAISLKQPQQNPPRH